MMQECYRCGAELGEVGGGCCCPQCGSPQLSLSESVLSTTTVAEDSTGEPPPPLPQTIDWRLALQCGMAVAAVGALLFIAATYIPAFSLFSLLWTLSSAVVAITLYRQRRPGWRMDGSIGIRIGFSVGLFTSAALAVTLAGAGLVARFLLHAMSSFDAEFARQMQQQIEHSLAANPASADALQQLMSQEFRTGVMLSGLLTLGAVILLVSALGGAFGGMLGVRRDHPAR